MKKYYKFLALFVLFLFCFYLIFVFYKNTESNYLKVVFLDVGQGDSIFIETPNKKQILIDGGPDSKILSSLSRVMPIADRSIDLVIVTHLDNDHIGGLPVLMDNYEINNLIKTKQDSSSKISSLLSDKIKNKNINEIIIENKKRIILDDNIYLDILFPNRDISNLEGNETSIVSKLVYGESSFMFTGDADLYIENILLQSESKDVIDSDILKLGHHGSRTSSSFPWLLNVSPDFAIIEAGKDNRYGHPHKETLERLEKLNIPYLSTFEIGNIIFLSDGKNITK